MPASPTEIGHRFTSTHLYRRENHERKQLCPLLGHRSHERGKQTRFLLGVRRHGKELICVFDIDAAAFAAVFVALYAAHQVGDHWVQTETQACTKGQKGRSGRVACLWHVASITATKTAVLGVVALVVGLSLDPFAVAAGLGIDAASHYWADRRTTLVRFAERVGKGELARLGDSSKAPVGTGAYALDQSWHIGWLLIAALLVSAGTA